MGSKNSAANCKGLKSLTAAVLGAAMLLLGADAALAFGHNKLRDTINRLTEPPPREKPTPQPAPEARPQA